MRMRKRSRLTILILLITVACLLLASTVTTVLGQEETPIADTVEETEVPGLGLMILLMGFGAVIIVGGAVFIRESVHEPEP